MSWITIEHGGRTHRFALVRADGGVWIGWPGGARLFRRESFEASRPETGSAEIRAPMTGKVVRLQAAAGRPVKAGEVVAVVEAMKMEYRLAAPFDGVIEAVSCVEGQRVDLGAVLARMRKP